jgi:hypothetical protein
VVRQVRNIVIVGEATWPSMRATLQKAGVSEIGPLFEKTGGPPDARAIQARSNRRGILKQALAQTVNYKFQEPV